MYVGTHHNAKHPPTDTSCERLLDLVAVCSQSLMIKSLQRHLIVAYDERGMTAKKTPMKSFDNFFKFTSF